MRNYLNKAKDDILTKNSKNEITENKSNFGKIIMNILNKEINTNKIREKTELTLAKIFGLSNKKITNLEQENLQEISIEQIMDKAENYFKKGNNNYYKNLNLKDEEPANDESYKVAA